MVIEGQNRHPTTIVVVAIFTHIQHSADSTVSQSSKRIKMGNHDLVNEVVLRLFCPLALEDLPRNMLLLEYGRHKWDSTGLHHINPLSRAGLLDSEIKELEKMGFIFESGD